MENPYGPVRSLVKNANPTWWPLSRIDLCRRAPVGGSGVVWYVTKTFADELVYPSDALGLGYTADTDGGGVRLKLLFESATDGRSLYGNGKYFEKRRWACERRYDCMTVFGAKDAERGFRVKSPRCCIVGERCDMRGNNTGKSKREG